MLAAKKPEIQAGQPTPPHREGQLTGT